MELLELPGWRVEFDRSVTVAAYERATIDGPVECGCDPCRNWALTREQIIPAALGSLLARLGVPMNREREVYHNARLESGLHLYGGWYHFVGRVLFGEQECSPFLSFERFSVYFHSKPSLLPEAFAGLEVVELQFDAEVPWLSEVPEPT